MELMELARARDNAKDAVRLCGSRSMQDGYGMVLKAIAENQAVMLKALYELLMVEFKNGNWKPQP